MLFCASLNFHPLELLNYTGEIARFINPKYALMSQIAAGIFILLFLVQLSRVWQDTKHNHDHCGHDCGHDHGEHDPFPKKAISYLIIIFPLLTGFALPPAVLDSSIAANKGSVLSKAANSQENTVSEPQETNDEPDLEDEINTPDEVPDDFDNSEEHGEKVYNDNYLSQKEFDKKMNQLKDSGLIDMTDDIYSPYYEEISETIKLFGFVYKEDGFNEDQLVVSRFLITHCVADASIVGFLSEFDEASTFEEDTWVEIEGTLDVATYNDLELPMVKVDQIKEVGEPDEPYIFPVRIQAVE
ncbi:TIGR03943 family putative permease subunit [Piscibacillus sp. B03]|uniref:TIGR03943 family putative permease subunit n=1 Tax=Piscibacillus sp. B03 TaxID=3457430 RepID=UPI003FCDF193